MNFCDINPFIRFAEPIYLNKFESNTIMVKDCRIFYCISGIANIFIENQHYECIPNSLFYCCAGSIYSIKSNSAELISLNFDLTQKRNHHLAPYTYITVSKTKPAKDITSDVISDSEFINSHLFVTLAEGCKEPLRKILDEFSIQKIYYRENASAILKSVLTQLHRYNVEGSLASTNAVSRTIAYIRANYNKPLTNAMLSELTGYHEYHLNRLFLTHTNTSLHKYILNVRINEAKKILMNTDLSLAAIAEKVGFNSNTHFSSYFKQVVGLSPLEFRKRFKNKI